MATVFVVPLSVTVEVPLLKVVLAPDVSQLPDIPAIDAPKVRVAEPETVMFTAVSPDPEDVPTVIVLPACVMSPVNAKLKVPMANVPVQPVVFSVVMETLTSTVAVPPPDEPSKCTVSADDGVVPLALPPLDVDQWSPSDQLPVPLIQ